jgi:hypothetical protein
VSLTVIVNHQVRLKSVASRPRFGYRQQPIHVSQVVAVAARWWRDGSGEVVAFRRQNQVRQLKDTWPLGFSISINISSLLS